jgi:poly(hydroxyalkanoate) granule-associated protein
MARKAKRPAATTDKQLAATVRRSAKEIWYAGLGVFSTTRDEGTKVYNALVAEGKRVEATARTLAQSQLAQVRMQITRATTEATKRATATWGSVEKTINKRAAAVKAKVSKLRSAKKAKRRAPARRTRRA